MLSEHGRALPVTASAAISKPTFKIDLPDIFAAFKRARISKLVCTETPLLLNQRSCRKYSYMSDGESHRSVFAC